MNPKHEYPILPEYIHILGMCILLCWVFLLLLLLLGGLGRSLKRSSGRGALGAWLAHTLLATGFDAFAFGVDVGVESFFHLQFQRLSEAALRVGRPFSSFMGPGIPLIRAQNDALRPSSAFVLGLGAGAFRFEPVARLYFARPFAVSPAPWDTGSFSPRETERLTCFLAIGLFRRRQE